MYAAWGEPAREGGLPTFPYQLKLFNGTGWCMQLNKGGSSPPPQHGNP
jgi:hypothetical protein